MLGWFAETTLVAALLAALAGLAGRFGRLGPDARHALWLVVLVKFACPPVVAWPWRLPAWPVATPRATAPVEPEAGRDDAPSLAVVAGTGAAVPRSRIAPISRPKPVNDEPGPSVVTIREIILIFWVVGTVVVVARRVVGIARFGRSVAGARPAPDWLVAEAGAIGDRLGIRPPPVLVVPVDGSPLLWCLGRPRLFVPDRLIGRLAADRWPGILAHELAHLIRRDHWVVRLELLAEAAWWWNPLFWLVRRRLRDEADRACDARVVRALPGRRFAYAEALVEVCEHLSRPSIAPPALGVGGDGASRSLEARLTMILGGPIPPRPGPRAALAVATLAALALPTWTLGQSPEPPKAEATAKPEKTVPEPAPTTPGAEAPGTTEPARDEIRPDPADLVAATLHALRDAQARLDAAMQRSRDPKDPAVVAARRRVDAYASQYRKLSRGPIQAASDEAELMRLRREGKAAEVKKGEARLDLARAVAARYEHLLKQDNAVSSEDVLHARTELKVAEADLAGKKAELAEADLRLEQARRKLPPPADRAEPAEAEADRDTAPARRRPDAVGPSSLADLRDVVELMEVQLQGKRADLRGAEAGLGQSRTKADRLKNLLNRAVIGPETFQDAEAKVQDAEVTLDRKKADVLEAEIRLKQARRRVVAEQVRLKRAIDRARVELDRVESLRKMRLIGEHPVEAARQALDDLISEQEPPR